MFDDNWYLFLLIILLLFTDGDGMNKTESYVLIGIVAGLLLSSDMCNNNGDIDVDDVNIT